MSLIYDQIEISPSISEVVSTKPKFFVRFGISMMVFLLIGIFISSWFITVPSTINIGTSEILKKDVEYFAEFHMPINKINQIQIGQKVYLRFDLYRWEKYGQLVGKIKDISRTADFAKVSVQLGSILRTDHNVNIEYFDGINAQSGIVVRKQRLFVKLYNDVIKRAN